jgi:hypothetical protein
MDSLVSPKQQKIDIRFSGSGSLKTVAREAAQSISVVIQVSWVRMALNVQMIVHFLWKLG